MRPTRYRISLTINRVEISVKFPCQLQVLWKRGNNRCITSLKEKNNSSFRVNETLQLDFTLRQNDVKKSQLAVLLNVEGQSKLAGLGMFLVKDDMSKESNGSIKLERSPDPNAKIHYSYKMTNMGECDDYSESRISEFSNQKTVLGESFGIIDKENTMFSVTNKSKTFNDLNRPILQQQDQNSNSSRFNKELTETRNKLNIQKELYDQTLIEMGELKQKIEQLNKTNGNLQNELSNYKKECKEQEIKIKQYHNEREYLNQEFECQQKEIKQLKQYQSKVEQLESQYNILDHKYKNENKRLKELEEKVDQCSNSRMETSTNTNYFEIQEMVEKERQLKNFEIKSQDLQRKLEKIGYENTQLRNQIKKSEEQYSQLRQQYDLLQQEQIEQNLQLQIKDKENQQLQDKLNKQETQEKNNQQSVNRSMSENQRTIQQLQIQYDSLKEQNNQLKNKYQELKVKYIQQNDTIDQLNEDLNNQSLQYLKDLQILVKKQQQFGIN